MSGREVGEQGERKQLLLVFVHGFASNDATFADFPEHLRTVLSNSLFCDVEAIVYPTYSTTGSLPKAVDDFCEWLLKTTEERLNWNGSHDDRECWTVILGHSMGGLLAADSIIKLKKATLRQHRILGLVAFDSPFYGVHPNVISQTAKARASSITEKCTSAVSLVSTVASVFNASRPHSTGSALIRSSAQSGVSTNKWAWAAASAGIAGALVGAYASREHITRGVRFLTGHLEFAGALISYADLRNRVETIRNDTDLMFRCFYNEVQCNNESDTFAKMRTFIELPPSATAEFFTKVEMQAEDEIDAHMNMFSPNFQEDPLLSRLSGGNPAAKANPAYYVLAQETRLAVVGMVERADAGMVRAAPFFGEVTVERV